MHKICLRFRTLAFAMTICVLLFMAPHQAFAKSGPFRFKLTMHDVNGTTFTVLISAPDEKVDVQSGWGWCQDGDKSVTGHYRPALLGRGRRTPIPQKVALFDGPTAQFRVGGNAVRVLKGRAKKQPDVLVVEQYFSSNGVTGRLFFIDRGRLKPVRFQDGKRIWLVEFWDWDGMKSDGNSRFHSTAYDNSDARWLHSTWKFEPKAYLFRRIQFRKSHSG